MRYSIILLLMVLTSCLVPPAPHHHKYIANDSSKEFIEVFCTPKNKCFIFNGIEGLEVEVCSKIIQNECELLEYSDFFETKAYTKDVEITEVRFHKLFTNDTLLVNFKSLGKSKIFTPVL